MNNRDALKGEEEVFRGSADLMSIAAAKVVEVRNLLEDEVDECNDDGDAERVGVHADNGDNVGPVLVVARQTTVRVDVLRAVSATAQPTEESEHCREQIDNDDGTDELERRKGEACLNTGDKDEPVLGQCDFQEQDTLGVTKVLNDTTTSQEQSASKDPGTSGK